MYFEQFPICGHHWPDWLREIGNVTAKYFQNLVSQSLQGKETLFQDSFYLGMNLKNCVEIKLDTNLYKFIMCLNLLDYKYCENYMFERSRTDAILSSQLWFFYHHLNGSPQYIRPPIQLLHFRKKTRRNTLLWHWLQFMQVVSLDLDKHV